jgi:hypothetical protein
MVIIHRHPDWWHSWHRDALLIGTSVILAGSLLAVLAVKKTGWVRWTMAPLAIFVLWVGIRFIYVALAL